MPRQVCCTLFATLHIFVSLAVILCINGVSAGKSVLSEEAPTSSTGSEPSLPLSKRVASLAGAVHLVVSKSSTGVYDVESRGGNVEGLLFYFARVSPFYTISRSGMSAATHLNTLLFNHTYSLCNGYRKQEHLFTVFGGKLMVQHGADPALGYICVSEDGLHYVPTGLTYEVLDVSLSGFVPLAEPPGEPGSTSALWRDPESIGGNLTIQALQVVHLRQYSSGSLKLAFDDVKPHGIHHADNDMDTTEPTLNSLFYRDRSHVRHMRFASTVDCNGSPFVLVSPDVPVHAINRLQTNAVDWLDFFISYQRVDVMRASNAVTESWVSSLAQLPVEFYVCVSVEKGSLYEASPPETTDVDRTPLSDIALQRFGALGSVDAANAAVRIFTAVPGLKIHLIPPPVSVKGMWLVPPKLANREMKVERIDAAGGVPAHYMLRAVPGRQPLKSMTTVHVSQFETPSVILEGSGLQEGMGVRLSRDNRCARHQPILHLDDTHPDMPEELDTSATVSRLEVDVTLSNGTLKRTSFFFFALNLNHTGMWGLQNRYAANEKMEVWSVCFSYSPLSDDVFLPALRIVVHSMDLVAVTLNDDTDAVRASVDVNVSFGFSGFLRLWGFNMDLWTTATRNSAEVVLAVPSGGNRTGSLSSKGDHKHITFNRAHGLSLVPADVLATQPATPVSDTAPPYATIIIPPGYLGSPPSQKLSLGISIPQPFGAFRRAYFATSATMIMRPPSLLTFGQHAVGLASDDTSNLPVVRIAEDSADIVFPVTGEGLRPGMLLFLTDSLCGGNQSSGSSRSSLAYLSRLNISIVSPYDVPKSYWDGVSAPEAQGQLYVVLTRWEHTSRATANIVFGAARAPLRMCLYAPGLVDATYAVPLRLAVQHPSIWRLLPPDRNDVGQLMYASPTDVIVEGFGLNNGMTRMIPAVDCGNASSFLWRESVTLSPVPYYMDTSGTESRTCYVDPQHSVSSWFLPLGTEQLSRIGAEASMSGVVNRFVWCVHYGGDSDTVGTHNTERFLSTGIPYRLVIPTVDGFMKSGAVVKRMTLPTQDKEHGQWQTIQLVGPLVDWAYTRNQVLSIFLAPEDISCKALNKYLVSFKRIGDLVIHAINGSAILLPRHLTAAGVFKLCASAVHLDEEYDEWDSEAVVQLFELGSIRLELVRSAYAFLSLNHTEHVVIDQEEAYTFSVSGPQLSTTSQFRLKRLDELCEMPMTEILENTVLQEGPILVSNTSQGDDMLTVSRPQVVLSRALMAGLSPALHRLCLKVNRSSSWIPTSVVLRIKEKSHECVQGRGSVTDGQAVALFEEVDPATGAFTNNVNGVRLYLCGARMGSRDWSLEMLYTNNSASVLRADVQRVVFLRRRGAVKDGCSSDTASLPATMICGPYLLTGGRVTIPSTEHRCLGGPFFSAERWTVCIEDRLQQWRQLALRRSPSCLAPLCGAGFRAAHTNPPISPSSQVPDTTQAFLFGDSGRMEWADLHDEHILTLPADQRSHVSYLRGDGVFIGQLLRFGAHCEEHTPASAHDASVRNAVMARQKVQNPLLYEAPLHVRYENGEFMIPSTHLTAAEDVVPLCVSVDGGKTYRRTHLALQVLPSGKDDGRSTETTTTSADVLEDTLVVPLRSRGPVNLTEMFRRVGMAVMGTVGAAPDRPNVYLPVGAEVMFSTSCTYRTEHLPLLFVATPNVVHLSIQHTRTQTQRLQLCVRLGGTSYADGFQFSGLHLRVLNVSVRSISVHRTQLPESAKHTGVEHIVLQRDGESLLLPVELESSESVQRDVAHGNSCRNTEDDCAKQRILSVMDTANGLALMGLVRFQVRESCSVAPVNGAAGTLVASSNLQAEFRQGSITVTSTDKGTSPLMVAIPRATVAPSGYSAPLSLCMSVDRGLHYVSIGTAFVSTGWDSTLRLRGEDGPQSTALAPWGTDFSASLFDTRFDDHSDIVSGVHYLNRFIGNALWTGFAGCCGYAGNGELYLPAAGENWGENDPITGTHPLYFTTGSSGPLVYTGLTVDTDPRRLVCLGNGPPFGGVIDVHVGSAGVLLPIAVSCSHGLSDGATVRVVEATESSCDVAHVDHRFVMDVAVIDAESTSATGQRELQLQLPGRLSYVPAGIYSFCIGQANSSAAALGPSPVPLYLPSPVRLRVVDDLAVTRMQGLADGTIVVFQGSNAVISVEGSATLRKEVKVMIGFAPAHPTDDRVRSVRWRRGRDSEMGHECDTLARPYGYCVVPPSDRLHPFARQLYTVKGGAIHIAATYLSVLTVHELYCVCYSVDSGRSFHRAGKNISIIVAPPAVTGVGWPRSSSSSLLTDTLPFDANTTTTSAIRIQRLATNASTAVEVRVVSYPGLLARVPSYYVPPVTTFVGNGIGARSGRTLPAFEAPYGKLVADSIPTLAAAVAIVRTSRHGPVCDGGLPNTIVNFGTTTSEGILATPVFLISLHTAELWTREDDTISAHVSTASREALLAFGKMNPVLRNPEWRNNTIALLAAGAIHMRQLMAMAGSVSEAVGRLVGESLLVCLSLDGVNFYSANTGKLPPIEETVRQARLSVAMPSPTPVPLSAVSSLPLVLLPENSIRTVYFARDLALVTTIVVRMNISCMESDRILSTCEDVALAPILNVTADSLTRFQSSLAAHLLIDPVILSVQVHYNGTLPSPTNRGQRTAIALPEQSRREGHLLRFAIYTVGVSVIADAIRNATGRRELIPAPEVLHNCASIFYNQSLHEALLGILFSGPQQWYNSTEDTYTISAATINFTFSSGEELHEASNSHKEAFARMSREDAQWLRSFLILPHNILSATHVPNSTDHGGAFEHTWLRALLLLSLPACLAYAVYYIYWRYIRPHTAPVATDIAVHA